MNALLARFIRPLRPANSETRDPLAEDAPSPLHRALRWSIPAAALWSILVSTAVLNQTVIPPRLAQLITPMESVLTALIAPLSVATLYTSVKGIGWSARRGNAPVFAALIILFNIATLFIAALTTAFLIVSSPIGIYLR